MNWPLVADKMPFDSVRYIILYDVVVASIDDEDDGRSKSTRTFHASRRRRSDACRHDFCMTVEEHWCCLQLYSARNAVISGGCTSPRWTTLAQGRLG